MEQGVWVFSLHQVDHLADNIRSVDITSHLLGSLLFVLHLVKTFPKVLHLLVPMSLVVNFNPWSTAVLGLFSPIHLAKGRYFQQIILIGCMMMSLLTSPGNNEL